MRAILNLNTKFAPWLEAKVKQNLCKHDIYSRIYATFAEK